jgi:putative transposase
MLVAHRIRLAPNNVQASYLTRAAGTARFAYNWALAQWQRQYAASKVDPALPRPNEMALQRQLNAIKRAEFPWMLEVTKNAPQMAIMQLGRAFDNFFAGRARYPRFRRKGRDNRFTLTNDQFQVGDKRIRIPKLGWVRMRESLRFAGRIVSATVARVADQWYASITVDTTEDLSLSPAENQGAVGIDLGVTMLATLSTGEKWSGPRALRGLLERLRRLGRAASRNVKGSRNRRKAVAKLARLHARIANLRREGLHQLTTSITRRFNTIGIEDLSVKGMLGNRRLARDRRHGLSRAAPPADVQGGLAWRAGDSRLPLVPQQQDLFVLRLPTRDPRPRATPVAVHVLRRNARPRRERRGQPQEHGGEFHRDGLWRGRHWPGAQAQGETGPDEAGIQ